VRDFVIYYCSQPYGSKKILEISFQSLDLYVVSGHFLHNNNQYYRLLKKSSNHWKNPVSGGLPLNITPTNLRFILSIIILRTFHCSGIELVSTLDAKPCLPSTAYTC